MPTSSVGSSYPAPSSNSSTTSSSGHFVNQTNSADHQFAGWDSVSTVQLDSCLPFPSSGNAANNNNNNNINNNNTSNGYLTGSSSCPAENNHPASNDSQSVSWTTTAAPAESVSPKSGKKPMVGLKNGQNKVSNGGVTGKIPSTMPTVKSAKKTKVKVQHLQNGKVASSKNNGNKKIPPDSGVGANNDGLTTQQLELIQEIMRQTQEQHRLMQEEQQQHIQHKPAQPTHPSGPNTSKVKKTSNKVKWTAPTAAVAADPLQTANCPPAVNATDGTNAATSGRPVECNVCQRRFKNTPALNGHMRLHGGFLKKDAECSGSNGSANGSNGSSGSAGGGGGSGKKPGESKKDPNTPPLLTASVSVRALIEEKIIQRRNNMAANNHSTSSSVATAASSSSSSTSSANSVVVVLQEQAHALPISVQATNPPEASVMMMDVLEDEPRETMAGIPSQSQPLIPKLEPEGYFEGKK